MFANRKTLIALLLLAATAAFSTASISTNYGSSNSNGSSGSFVGAYVVANGGMTTFHSDGTLSGIQSNMFSFEAARDYRRTTPSQGVWHNLGKNKVQATTILYLTEQNGDAYDPFGLLVKVSYVAEFDKPVKGKSPGYTTSNVTAEVFSPGSNPNVDAPIYTTQLQGVQAYRLQSE